MSASTFHLKKRNIKYLVRHDLCPAMLCYCQDDTSSLATVVGGSLFIVFQSYLQRQVGQNDHPHSDLLYAEPKQRVSIFAPRAFTTITMLFGPSYLGHVACISQNSPVGLYYSRVEILPDNWRWLRPVLNIPNLLHLGLFLILGHLRRNPISLRWRRNLHRSQT